MTCEDSGHPCEIRNAEDKKATGTFKCQGAYPAEAPSMGREEGWTTLSQGVLLNTTSDTACAGRCALVIIAFLDFVGVKELKYTRLMA